MRRVWIGLLTALLVLGLADALAWSWATKRLEARYNAWAQAQRAAGWTIDSGPPRREGWPLSAALVIPHPRLSPPAAAEPGPLSWSADRLTLRLPLRFPPRLVVQPGGAQRLRLPVGPPMTYHAAQLAVAVRLSLAGRPRDARLEVRDLIAGTTPHRLSIGFARARLDRTGPPPAIRFAFSLRDINLPHSRTWPLGRRIAALGGHGTIDGPLPGAGSPRQRLRTWQKAGGTLRLRQAALRWGPLTASLDAQLGLDPDLRPAGQGEAMVRGYDQALDTLAANHALSNDSVVAAKAVLSLLADAPDHQAAGTVAIPFTLRAGRLDADGMPLLRLPPLLPTAPAAQGASG